MIKRMVVLCLFLASSPLMALEIIGHRGAAALAPENTLSSYKMAIAMGADRIDIDVMLSKDNILIAHHNAELDKDHTRNARGLWIGSAYPVLGLTYEQLRMLDVGLVKPESNYAKKFPLRTLMKSSENIASLSEIIDYAEQSTDRKIHYQMELKTSPLLPNNYPEKELLVKAIASLLVEKNIVERTDIQAFEWPALRLLQHYLPSANTAFLTHVADPAWGSEWMGSLSFTNPQALPKQIYELGGKIWGPHYKELTQSDIERAHQLGLKVKPWTVDEPGAMLRLAQMGVDGIITNRPDILRSVLSTQSENFSLSSGYGS